MLGRSLEVANAAFILFIFNIHLGTCSKVTKKQPHIITFIADDWGIIIIIIIVIIIFKVGIIGDFMRKPMQQKLKF